MGFIDDYIRRLSAEGFFRKKKKDDSDSNSDSLGEDMPYGPSRASEREAARLREEDEERKAREAEEKRKSELHRQVVEQQILRDQALAREREEEKQEEKNTHHGKGWARPYVREPEKEEPPAIKAFNKMLERYASEGRDIESRRDRDRDRGMDR